MEIEIDISDKKIAYAIAAYVLDQDGLSDHISTVRKSWGLKDPIPYQNFQNWLNKSHINLSFTPEAAKTLEYATDRFEIDASRKNISLYEDLSKNKQLSEVRIIEYELEYTLRKFNLDATFKQFILRAIVCNKVRENDLPNKKSTRSGLYQNWLFDDLDYNVKNYNSDTKPEIKRDREWYKLKKTGLSYLKIAETTKHRGKIDPKDFEDNVKKQVKRYKRFLKGGHLQTL